MLRNILCWVMMVVFPLSLLAADSGAAMLYTQGRAWVNGRAALRSTAIFQGDLVQTQPDGVAHINAPGSSVLVLADSLVKFEGAGISLEHGRVAVGTGKGMVTRAGEVTVTPASKGWTEFEVGEREGTVQIVARRGDVSINDGSQSSTLSQGQQTTVNTSTSDEKRKKKKRRGAAAAASGGILDSPLALGIGAGAVGGILIWVLTQNPEPPSPSKPN